MIVDWIQLCHFRNYGAEKCSFLPGINVIVGENAQGKTNLLEAVFLLTGGKSFRTRLDRELIAFEQETAKIESQITAQQRQQHIQITLRRGKRKEILKNKVKQKGAELSSILNAVVFSPDDLYLVKGSPALRRKLMDIAISQLRPGYAALLTEFQRIHDHKSKILSKYRDHPGFIDTLEEFSYHLCKVSAAIIRYRAAFCQRLSPIASEIHQDFSQQREQLKLTYRTIGTVTDPTAPLNDIFSQVMAHQKSHKEAELLSGQCLTGIHKDDILIEINEKPAKNFASQGQTRTAALSIKLAEREIFLQETGEYPILLLDDILSELDAGRQEFVLNRIGGGQTLITCCEDIAISKKTGGNVVLISNGQIGEV